MLLYSSVAVYILLRFWGQRFYSKGSFSYEGNQFRFGGDNHFSKAKVSEENLQY